MAQIELRHFNIAGSNYYHTYLVFIDDNGMRREIHGDPYDRATGDPTADPAKIVGPVQLKGQVFVGVRFSGDVEQKVYNMSQADLDQKFEAAISVIEYINNQNIEYVLAGFFGAGVNSNSTTNSIMTALGLAFPNTYKVVDETGQNEFKDVSRGVFEGFAPGFSRDLLPGQGFDALAGNAYRLTGDGDQNSLFGGAGNDELFGEGGDDLLVGRGGDDLLDGGSGNDTADYSNEAEQPTLRSDGKRGQTDKTLPKPVNDHITINIKPGGVTVDDRWSDTDTLTSIEHIIGSDVQPAAGKAGDVIQYDKSITSVQQVQSKPDDPPNSFRLLIDGHEILFEDVELLRGHNPVNNTFVLFNLVAGIDGVAGDNKADFSNLLVPVGVWIDLASETMRPNLATSDPSLERLAIDIDEVIGSEFADVILGSADAERIDGGGGDDIIAADAGDTLAKGQASDLLYWGSYSRDSSSLWQLTGGVKDGWAYHPNDPVFKDGPYKGRYGETYEVIGGDLIIKFAGESDPITIENWKPGDYGIQLRNLVTSLPSPPELDVDLSLLAVGTPVAPGGAGFALLATVFSQLAAYDPWEHFRLPDGSLVSAWYYPEDLPWFDSNGDGQPDFDGLDNTRNGTGGDDEMGGTGGDDKIVGGGGNDSLSGGGGRDVLLGGVGQDVLEGDAGVDQLEGGEGADALRGGDGDDRLKGGTGDDTLDGGAGKDVLDGGGGDDTYIFNRGDGQDTVYERGSAPFLFIGELETDVLRFGEGIRPEDIAIDVRANSFGELRHLDLVIDGSSDKVTVDGHFLSFHDGIDRVVFADGTVWSRADIEAKYLAEAGTAAGDHIYGFDGNERLAGGLGDDQLEGGKGDDTYLFNLGDGQDEVRDFGGKVGQDRLLLGPGITTDMVSLSRPEGWHSLTLTIGAGGDRVVLQGQFSGRANGVEAIVFDDGTVWDWAYLADRVVAEGRTTGGDTIHGTVVGDNLLGGAGDDTLRDFDGDDRLEGGSGNDLMTGGTGDDTYVYNLGDGQDRIFDDGITFANSQEGTNDDRLVFGAGIEIEDLRFAYGGAEGLDLVITVAGGGGITIEKQAEWRGMIEHVVLADGTDLYVTYLNELASLDDGSLSEILGTGAGETLTGTANGDRIVAGAGQDTVEGGGGQDLIFGGAGNDVLDGGAEKDWIFGGDGDDILRAGAGGSTSNDVLSGGRGADTLDGSDGKDRLFGDQDNDSLSGAGGADFLSGGAGDDRLAGGAGSDSLVGGSGSDTYVYNAGDGVDRIDAGRDKLAGDLNALELGVAPGEVSLGFEGADLVIEFPGNGNDRLTVKDFLGKGSLQQISFSDSTVRDSGEILAQALSASPVGDTPSAVNLGDGVLAVYGGKGNDQLVNDGGLDPNLYIFAPGDGQDGIYDGAALPLTVLAQDDTLLLTGGIRPEDVHFARSAEGDLTLTFEGSTDQIFIRGQFYRSTWGVETIRFDEGTSWSRADIRAAVVADQSTSGGDLIVGFDKGSDTIRGGAGDDDLRGGLGNDVYLFAPGDGADTILDTDLSGNFENDSFDTIRFGAGIVAAEVSVERSGLDPNDLVLRINDAGDRITVDDQFASPAIGIERVEFHDGTTWTEAQIRQWIIDAEVSASDDQVLGFDGAEVYQGGAGNDTLIGGDGDDLYIFQSGDGQDVIDDAGSSDGDRLLLGSGITPDGVTLIRATPDSADVTLSFAGGSILLKGQFGAAAGVGIERIVFADGGEWSAAELESRFLAAATTGGNDEIHGFAGSDTLVGGLGNDLLDSGAGADTYAFALGDGQDVIDDSGPETGAETLALGEGIGALDLELRPDPLNGNDLLITFRDGSDQITVKNHFGPAGPKLGAITFADGSSWDAAAIAAAAGNTAPSLAQAIAAQTAYDDNGFFFLVPDGTFADAGDSLTLTATLENGDPLPAWLDFDGAAFTGVPTDGDLGALRVKVVATDSFGTTTGTVFDLTVENSNDAPFATQALPTQSVALDAAFSYSLPAGLFDDVDAGDAAGLTYYASLADGGLLPAWLSFDGATQTFSGTPTGADAGPLLVMIQAVDSSGATASVELGLRVGLANAAPALGAPVGDQTATEDQAFIFAVPDTAFSDADLQDRLTFSASLINGDPLPSWLGFENGVFTGTPGNGEVGALSVKVTATDIAGATAEATFNLTVANVNDAPETDAPLGSWAVYEDDSFAYDLPSDAFRDDDAGDSLTLTATLGNGAALPNWLTFDGARLSGTPDNDAVGAYTVTIRATDTAGASTSTDIMVVVLPVNDAPVVVNPVAAQSTNQYEDFSFIVPINVFRDVDSDGLGYTARLLGGDALPDWLSFDPLTRTFSGTPGLDAVGSFEGSRVLQIELTADDGDGGTVSTTFDLTVVSPNPGQEIIGTAVGEDLVGTPGPDLIDGRGGNDRLTGKEGLDTYLFDVGYGEDVIAGSHKNAFDVTVYGESDILRLGPGITTDDIIVERAGSDFDDVYRQDLVLRVAGTGDRITIEDQFDSRNGQGPTIGEIRFEDGTVWTAEEVTARFLVTTLGDDVLAGGGGADTLIGGEGNDVLYGLDGDDVLDGGAGDDELYGSNGDDTYVFGIGYGHDKLFDSNSNVFARGFDTLKFGAGIRLEDMIFTRDPNDPNASGAPPEAGSLLIEIEGTDDSLRIYKQFLIDNGVSHGVDRFEFADGTVMTREEFEDFVFPGNIIEGTASGETLFGTADDETLIGGQGADTIYGEEGDDVYVWNLGDGNDVISEFRINSFDILRLGPGVSPDGISLSHVGDIGAAAAGYHLFLTVDSTSETIEIRWAFDYDGFTEVPQRSIDIIAFDDGTVWDHDFLTAYFLTGTPGNDVLEGFSERRDDLDGGLGNDVLKGRSHHDTYYFGFNYGTDYILDSYDSLTEGSIGRGDRIVFHEGVRSEDIRITREFHEQHPVDSSIDEFVVDTVLRIGSTADRLIVRGDEFYRDPDWITRIIFNEDGTNWNFATLRSIYLDQSETDGDDTIFGFEGDDTVRGGLGNDTLDGGRGNDVLRGGAGDDVLTDYQGNDVLFGDDGNDTLIDSEGDDSYFGGAGDDTFDTRAEVTDGTDVFKGGGGTDVVLFSGNFADYSFSQEADGAIRVGNTILYQAEILRFADGDVQAATLFPGNNPPNEIFLSNASIDETAANGALVGLVTAADPDPSDSLTLSLINDAGGRFALDPASGQLTVADAGLIDFEAAASHTVVVRVTDSTGFTYTQSFEIAVNDINEAPSDLSLSNAALDENAALGALVGTVTASDADAGETFSFALTGNAGGRFAIDAASGEISVADGSLLDFESAASHGISVQVTDSALNTYTEDFVISLNDVNETPTDLALSNANLDENTPTGTVVGTITPSDPDAAETFSFALTENAGGRFAINTTSGEITVADSSLIDFEAAASHLITVQVTDSANNTYSEDFTIVVNDTNDPPAVADQVFSLAENAVAGALVGTVVATDPDASGALTYAITGGTGASAFAIDAATGVLALTDAAALDFETVPSLTLIVEATDGGLLSGSGTVTIGVTDVNEAPTEVLLSGSVVDENAVVGTLIGSLTAIDPDLADTATWELLDNAGGRFQLAGHQLQVADGSLLDFETAASHDITLRATDAGGLAIDRTFAIAVNDVPEGGSSPVLPSELTGLVLWFDPTNASVLNDATGDGLLESVTDLSGRGNGGSALGAARKPFIDPRGINGLTALTFDGLDDAVRIGDTGDLNLVSTTGRTLSLVFETGADVTGRQVIYEEGGENRGLNIYIENGQLHIAGWNLLEENWGPLAVSQAVGANEVHSASLVFDGAAGSVAGYLDGQLIGAQTAPDAGTLYAHSQDIGLGGMVDGSRFADGPASGNGFHFAGKIGETVFYNRALDASELDQIHDYLTLKWKLLAGTSGNDTLAGTAEDDRLVGLAGDDTIFGKAGNDALEGGAGADALFGDAPARGLELNGTGHVRLENFTALPTTAFTIEVEFSTSDTANDGTLLSYAYGNNSQANEIILYDYKALQVTIGNQTVTTGLSFNDGETHRLTVTWDSSDGALQIYDNGTVVYSGTLQSGYSLHSGGTMVLGQEQDKLGGGFQSGQAVVGRLGAFKIWNAALTATEVAAGAAVAPSSTVVDFRFDEGEGSQTVDAHAGLTARLVGGVSWAEGGDGNDTLLGGAGADLLTGGAGEDIFVFADGGGQDRITDFDPGSGYEIIDLDAVASVDSFATLMALTTQVGDDTVIDFGNGDTVTLEGVAASALSSEDFRFTRAASEGADELLGTAGADVVDGLGGDDVIRGLGGADELNGGAGADHLIGDAPVRGVSLDGTGHVRIENFTMLPTTAFTIEVEFSTNDTTRDGTLVSYAYGNRGQANEIILYDYKALQITIGNETLVTGLSFNDGEAHRLTVTWDSSDGAVQVYDNGAIAFSGVLQASYSLHTGGTMVLGQEQDTLGGGFQSGQAVVGEIFSFNIWDTALTGAEVAAGRSDVASATVAEFRFDEGVGSQTVDSHAGLTAQLEGGVSWSDGDAGDDLLRGGDGDDTLEGGRGSDTLEGGVGNDLMTGGVGDDTFIFRNGDGQDTVSDLQSADKVDVTDFGFASFSDLSSNFSQVGADVLVQLDADDAVTLIGVNMSDLQEGQFLI